MKSKKIFFIIPFLLALLLIFTSCKKDKTPSSSTTGSDPEIPSPDVEVGVENNTPQEDISDILTIDGEKKTISSVLDFSDVGSSTTQSDTSAENSSSESSQESSISTTSSSSSSAVSEKAKSYNYSSSSSPTGTASSSKKVEVPSSSTAKTYSQSTPLKDTSDLDARLSDLAVEVLGLINEERAAAGIAALIPDPTLDEAAAIRSLEALNNPDLGHTRPDGTKALTVLKELNYSKENLTMGENLVFTAYDAEAKKIVELWRNSKGHYDNYMDPTYLYTGISITFDENATYQLVGAQIFSN